MALFEIFIVFVCFLVNKLFCQNCLVIDPDDLEKCLYCKNGYFSKESSDSGENPNFNPKDCEIWQKEFQEIEIFISPSGCDESQGCDGSLANPLRNLWEAMKFGEKLAERTKAISINFYLLQAPGDSSKKDYFFDRVNASTQRNYFFRRSDANISIKPLYCFERDIFGCYQERAERPRLYIRTDNSYFFIANSLLIENIVFDGSEILLDDLAKINGTYNQYKFCNNEALLNETTIDYSVIEQICNRNKQILSNQMSGQAFINMEPIIDTPNLLSTKSCLSVKNCEFNYFTPSSQDAHTITAIISVTKLSYQILIFNSSFLSNSLPDGVLCSFDEEVPLAYQNLEREYNYFLNEGKKISETDFVLALNHCSFASYNNFEIRFRSYKEGIISISSVDHNIRVLECLFKDSRENVFSQSAIFFIGYGNNIQSRLYFGNNTIFNNTLPSFLFFARDGNYLMGRPTILFEFNQFILNKDTNIDCAITDIIFNSNKVHSIQLTLSFISVNIGLLLVKNCEFFNFTYGIFNKQALFLFKGLFPFAALDILYNNNMNMSVEYFSMIQTSLISVFVTVLRAPNILYYLWIQNNTFLFGGIDKQYILFEGSVEDLFLVTDNIFENILADTLFKMKYTRDIVFDANVFKNITVNYIQASLVTTIVLEIKLNFSRLLILNSNILINAFNILYNYLSTHMSFNFSEILFKNIIGNGKCLLDITPSGVCNFSKISFEEIINLVCMCTTDDSSDFKKELILFEVLFLETNGGGNNGLAFISFTNYLNLTVNNSKFFYFGNNNYGVKQGSMVQINSIIQKKSSFASCNFFGNQAENGGALYLKASFIDSLLIKGCLFIENKGRLFGADIILEILLTSTKFLLLFNRKNFDIQEFGFVDNKFIASHSPSGGSIYLFPFGQLFLTNNSFLNITGQVAGAIFLREKCDLISSLNTFTNLKGFEEGGVLSASDSKIYFLGSKFERIEAQSGGAFYFENVVVNIQNCDFTKMEASFGFILNAFDSRIAFKNSNITESVSLYRGAFVLSKTSFLLWFVNGKKSNSRGTSAFIHSDKSKSLDISNVFLEEILSSSGAAIYIHGKGNTAYIIEKVFILNNKFIGDCIYGSDIEIKIKDLTILNANSKVATLLFESFQKENIISLSVININSTKIDGALFISKSGILRLENISVLNTVSMGSNLKLFTVKYSRISIRNLVFKAIETIAQGYIFNIEASLVDINDTIIELSSNTGALYFESCLLIYLTRLFISRESVKSFGLQAYSQGIPSCLVCNKGNIKIQSSHFGNLQTGEDPALYCEHSSLTIEYTIIKNLKFDAVNKLPKAAIVLMGETGLSFIIKDSLFYRNERIDLSFAYYSVINISNTTFVQAAGQQKSLQAVLGNDNVIVVLMSVTIQGYGGLNSISLNSEQTSTILIIFSIIRNSWAYASGGCLSLRGSYNITITNSVFQNISTNDSGGAFYFSCQSQSCLILIEKNTFITVRARKYGAILFSENMTVGFNKAKNELINIIESDIQSTSPAKIKFLKEATLFNKNSLELNIYWAFTTEFSNCVSGKPMRIVGILLDSNDNFLKYEEIGQVKFVSNSPNSSFINDLTTIQKGFIIYSDLTLNGLPGTNITATLIFSSSETTFNQSISFALRDCIRGEIISGITCQECPAGLFSLVDKPKTVDLKTCNKCPPKAECPGRDEIIPSEGYWRMDENQSLIYKCLKEQACPGGGNFTQEGKFIPFCSKGFKGPLCFLCEKGYGYDSENLCINCSKSPFHYAKFAILSFLSLAWIVYQTLTAFKIDEESSKRRALVKIMVDHMSYGTFIFSLKIEWISLISSVMSFADQYISTVPKDIFNFDCFFSYLLENEDRYVVNAVLISFTPIIYFLASIVLLIMYTEMRCCKRSKHHKKERNSIISGCIQNNISGNIKLPDDLIVYEPSPTHDLAESLEPFHIIISAKDKSERQIPFEITDPRTNIQDPEPSSKKIRYEPREEAKNGESPKDGKLKEKKFRKSSRVTTMLIIIFYNFYPRLMMNAVKLFRCVELDDTGLTYVEFLPMVQCWKGKHIKMVVLISVLNIFFWGLATPYLLFLITKQIIKVQKRTENINLKKVMNFITMDYKPVFYHWDLHAYYTKFLVVFLTVISYPLDASSQGALLIFFFLLLIHIQESFKPYSYVFINNLKTVSYSISVMSAIFAIMGSNKDLGNEQRFFSLTCSILFLYSFYPIWAFYFVRLLIQERQNARKKTKDKNTNKICSFLEKYLFKGRKNKKESQN